MICQRKLCVLSDKLFSVLCLESLDALGGVEGLLAAVGVHKVVTCGGLEQDLLVACGVTVVALGLLDDQSSGFGVVQDSADLLLHGGFSFR